MIVFTDRPEVVGFLKQWKLNGNYQRKQPFLEAILPFICPFFLFLGYYIGGWHAIGASLIGMLVFLFYLHETRALVKWAKWFWWHLAGYTHWGALGGKVEEIVTEDVEVDQELIAELYSDLEEEPSGHQPNRIRVTVTVRPFATGINYECETQNQIVVYWGTHHAD